MYSFTDFIKIEEVGMRLSLFVHEVKLLLM